MTTVQSTDLHFSRDTGFELGPLSLDFASGSRTAVAGPSGCGKTTLLRCLAGLERPLGGVIRFGDRVVFGPGVDVAPSQRRIGFVFQDGALWPHKTALAHLRFVAPGLTQRDASELLATVGLSGLERRRPGTLSGGECRRLALARALAAKPAVLMLDEPLHSVDVHLRDELALVIRRVTQQRGLTLVVVTHDRDAALAMADRIVVMRDGHIVERGSAPDLLGAPRTSFTAGFLGRAACYATTLDGSVLVTPLGRFERNGTAGAEVDLVVLPGEARLAEPGQARARVLGLVPAGGRMLAQLECAGRTLIAEAPAGVVTGQEVGVELRGAPRFLPRDARPEPSR